jgi:hypothetical protein
MLKVAAERLLQQQLLSSFHNALFGLGMDVDPVLGDDRCVGSHERRALSWRGFWIS